MSYQGDLKKHLAEFKRRDLGIRRPGVFRYRGRDVLRDHILPLAKASANLLEEAEPAASAFLAAHPHKRHRYFHHLNSYRAVLADHLENARLERFAFFDAYQFNRNVWHMVRTDHSRLIFLLPRSNAGLWGQLQCLLCGIVPRTRERVSAIAIEDVIADLSADSLCPQKLRDHARKRKRKYLIQGAT